MTDRKTERLRISADFAKIMTEDLPTGSYEEEVALVVAAEQTKAGSARRDAFNDGELCGTLMTDLYRDEARKSGFPPNMYAAAADVFVAAAFQRFTLVVDSAWVENKFIEARMIAYGSGGGKSVVFKDISLAAHSAFELVSTFFIHFYPRTHTEVYTSLSTPPRPILSAARYRLWPRWRYHARIRSLHGCEKPGRPNGCAWG